MSKLRFPRERLHQSRPSPLGFVYSIWLRSDKEGGWALTCDAGHWQGASEAFQFFERIAAKHWLHEIDQSICHHSCE